MDDPAEGSTDGGDADRGRFARWTPDDEPGEVIDVARNSGFGWQRIKRTYAPRGDEALDQVVRVAQDHGVVSVFAEHRYIDLDFRSEHSQFYSGTFRRYPSVCHRLHFFTEQLDENLRRLPELRVKDAYRGYSVMRPTPTSPVGRTMMAPPPSLEGAAITQCTDNVDIFGTAFQITGAPFVSQDQQYSRCSHAALWMVLYLHHLQYESPRYLPAAIHLATQGGEVHGREMPSEGLTTAQMMYGLQRLGLSPVQLSLPSSRRSDGGVPGGLFGILRRSVDSCTPAIIIGEEHVWVVVGYRYERSGRRTNIVLIRHDDARGPYIEVRDPWNEPLEAHRPWKQAIIPLPPKIYLTGERADILGTEDFLERVLKVFGSVNADRKGEHLRPRTR